MWETHSEEGNPNAFLFQGSVAPFVQTLAVGIGCASAVIVSGVIVCSCYLADSWKTVEDFRMSLQDVV